MLGALGSGLTLLVLNLVGRLRKGSKKYWIYYKEGNERITQRMINNVHYYERIKHHSLHLTMESLIMLCLLIGTLILSAIEKCGEKPSIDLMHFVQILVGISWGTVLFSAARYYRLWLKANKIKQEEIEEKSVN